MRLNGASFCMLVAALLTLLATSSITRADDHDTRMAWWREARFGMFIHWGLYAVPGGEWGGKATHGEWIRSSAQIPLAEYDTLRDKFNPVKFDADAIVLAAKNAGMGYIVITTKHHDGFCLFDSAQTDFDVMSTPFKRDIMREMADACSRHGIRIGWYYSIMDWHHPDYLPRREWEKDRPTEAADFERYVTYMKAQLKELLTNYGDIGVLWFDGQWEGNWNDVRGKDLEAYVRSLAPNIIINSRVGRAGGDHGLDTASGMLGDYATPEQFIPDAPPGFDWETCMTMNGHWGYNCADKDFKSTTTLIRNLADIASKGGNFLLNIGPTELGEIPPESVDRLNAIGEWWKVNGEAIRGTSGSPFSTGHLPWGRCTIKADQLAPGTTRLYLHVFDWPTTSELDVPGIFNGLARAAAAFPLASPPARAVEPFDGNGLIKIPIASFPNTPGDSVVVLDVAGTPDIAIPPTISAAADIFIDSLPVILTSKRENIQVRYTLDGADPAADSPIATDPITLDRSTEVRAACFRDGRAVSPVAKREFHRVLPRPPATPAQTAPGVLAQVFSWETGDIQSVAAMTTLFAIDAKSVADFSLKNIQPREKHWGVIFRGLIRVPSTGVYEFSTASDDGSRLWIGNDLIVDNDKPHSFKAERGVSALQAGLHPIRVEFFENWGGCDLQVMWREVGQPKQVIAASELVHEP